MWLAEKGGNVYSHPYDLGAFENLTTVLTTACFCFPSFAWFLGERNC